MRIKYILISSVGVACLVGITQRLLLTKDAQQNFMRAAKKTKGLIDKALINYSGGQKKSTEDSIALHQSTIEKKWLEVLK